MSRRKCRVCGIKFHVKICTQKFCSIKCYRIYYKTHHKKYAKTLIKDLSKSVTWLEIQQRYNLRNEKKQIESTYIKNTPIKILTEEESLELEEICDELKYITFNSYECACCKNIFDVEEHFKYEDRKYKLIKVNFINSDVDCRHHIIPRKYGENNEEINLIFLCGECHNYIEIMTEEWIQSGKNYDIDILKFMIINDAF